MSIEKEALEYLGFNSEDFKSVDEFKNKFDSTFIKQSNITEDSEPVKKILGKTYGTLENEIKKVAKAFDLDINLDDDSLKGRKVTDKMKYAFEKYNEQKSDYIKELEKASTQGVEEKVSEWKDKYEKTNQKAKDLQNLLNTTKSDFEQSQTKWQSEIKGVKLDVLTNDAFSKVKLKGDISEFEKKGYFSTIKEKYVFDLDETGSLVVNNTKGERIPSTKTSGTFKTIDEILDEEAVAGKLYQLNDDGGKKKNVIDFGQRKDDEFKKPLRKIAKPL